VTSLRTSAELALTLVEVPTSQRPSELEKKRTRPFGAVYVALVEPKRTPVLLKRVIASGCVLSAPLMAT
jgi:hypothetical protein